MSLNWLNIPTALPNILSPSSLNSQNFLGLPVTDFRVHAVWELKDAPEFLQPDYCIVTQTMEIDAQHIWKTQQDLDKVWICKTLCLLPPGCWMAGGSMVSMFAGIKHTGDIDLFFDGPDSFEAMAKIVETNDIFKDYKKKVSNNMSRTWTYEYVGDAKLFYKPNIQLVKLVWFESMKHVIGSFDFTICQIASDGTKIEYGESTMEDIANREIVLNKVHCPPITLSRLMKYAGRGFSASPTTLNSFLGDTVEIAKTDPDMMHPSLLFYDEA